MFTAILKNGAIENKSFRNIQDLNEIIALESEDIALVAINFTTGYITVGGQLQKRLQGYFCAYGKPIQYRQVVEELTVNENGLIDEEKPTIKFEEQTIGYEYTKEDKKVKIEITSNQEVNSIVAKITTTDLTTKQKSESYIRLR